MVHDKKACHSLFLHNPTYLQMNLLQMISISPSIKCVIFLTSDFEQLNKIKFK